MPSSTARSAEILHEKARTVLWAFTPDGIVLNNFARRVVIELDAQRRFVWEYLDGAHSSQDIAVALLATFPELRTRVRARNVVAATVRELGELGFLSKAGHG